MYFSVTSAQFKIWRKLKLSSNWKNIPVLWRHQPKCVCSFNLVSFPRSKRFKFLFFYFLGGSVSEEYSEDSAGSIPASLLEEQIRQRSSIVFNIDEDDYLVSNFLFLFIPFTPHISIHFLNTVPYCSLYVSFSTDKENLFNNQSFIGWQSFP